MLSLISKGYAINMAEQAGVRGKPRPITELGVPLDEQMLENFRSEQIVQLYELMKAAKELKNEDSQ